MIGKHLMLCSDSDFYRGELRWPCERQMMLTATNIARSRSARAWPPARLAHDPNGGKARPCGYPRGLLACGFASHIEINGWLSRPSSAYFEGADGVVFTIIATAALQTAVIRIEFPKAEWTAFMPDS